MSPIKLCKGKSVAGGRIDVCNTSVLNPKPRFARSLPIVELHSPVGEIFLRRLMGESIKGNISDLQFGYFPLASTLDYWRTNFETENCTGSDHPAEAMPWINEVEQARSIDDLKTSQSPAITSVMRKDRVSKRSNLRLRYPQDVKKTGEKRSIAGSDSTLSSSLAHRLLQDLRIGLKKRR